MIHEAQMELCRVELLHELFEEQARAHPERMALACGAERLAYGELEDKANQLARHLRALGVGRGSLVGLWLQRSLDAYVGLLGILKAGAGYVPLDPDYPQDRVQYILADSGACALITVSALANPLSGFSGRTVLLDLHVDAIRQSSIACLTQQETGAEPTDLCYVIYTSGSTGRPKGVAIEHRSACHLVRAEGAIFQVRPQDRVYQGFSLAFDASVEEIWLAFFAGATLVAGTREMVYSGPNLSRHLTEAGVTVFSTVPTQLAMMTEDSPSVRLLILGGEVCPQDLVRRWARPGRRMVNTYGPTEATVIATWGDLRLGETVTIGRPVPNYCICLLDEQLREVGAGVPGEICIGGIGLARGYVGRPELTQEKFITNPLAVGEAARLYRTGDLARLNAAGELEFLGRLDTQVKLRGYRVELAEVESVLLECPGVQVAVVTVREDAPGVQQLVGYVVPVPGQAPTESEMKQSARRRLPAYMVPVIIETLAELPHLPSGKTDRNALPAPHPRITEEQENYVAPQTALEKKLAQVWEKHFAPQRVSVKADFFLDLGGHSLLAARVVSEMRQDDDLRGVSILDIYQHPTLEKLAACLELRPAAKVARAAAPVFNDNEAMRIPWWRHFLCGSAQAISLYLVLGIFSLQWLAPYFSYTWTVEQGYERWEAILIAFTVLVGIYPLMMLLAIAIKWLVIGRYRAGEYPLWGLYYFRFWLVHTIQSSVPVAYLSGTPWLNWYYRLLGAKVGKDVHLSTPGFTCSDLVSVGDRTCVGAEASLTGYHVENGRLIIGSIQLGCDCFVGARAVVRENTTLEDGAALEDLSLLSAGKTIPTGQRWQGSPARPVKKPPVETTSLPTASTAKKFLLGFIHALGISLFPACVFSAILPGVVLLNYLGEIMGGYWFMVFAPLIGLSYVVFLCLEIVVFKWLLLGRVRAGNYALNSFFYVRKWFVDQLLMLSLDVIGSIYASIFLAPWYRMLGAKLGRRAEISTASFISPDLLSVGDESFIADSVSLGSGRVENGQVRLDVNHVGNRAFVGNSAVMPPGTVLGNNALLGCLSIPPANPESAREEGATWLGSPSMRLQQRQPSTTFALETTFKPTAKLQAQRATIEFIRAILPVTGFIILTCLLFRVTTYYELRMELWQVLTLFPLWYGGCGLLAVAFMVTLKWVLAGRYQPGEQPLWSFFVWRNELLNAAHEHLACDYIVNMLPGTPFICWYFRLLGAQIGKRVYLDSTDITEFDLVTLGNEAEINADATLQTHLFEDRVMKMSRVEIGDHCTVGSVALVLYDAKMESGSQLNDLSLLMKGETLPVGTCWEGIPAREAVMGCNTKG